MQRKSLSFHCRITGVLAVVFTPLFAPSVARADTKSSVQAKTSTFYRWYVGELNHNRDPFANRAMMRRSASRRLEKWLYSPAYREYGADYFIDAQDFDSDWGTVRATNFQQRGNTASLKVVLGKPRPHSQGIGEQKLQLKWVREGGVWKIDRVNNH